ncbi:MAG: hypothetical protein AAGK14_08250 [Verrucomicrobiota bacterium]
MAELPTAPAKEHRYAILSHIYDEAPRFDPDTPPEEQIDTRVLADSVHLDLETRFVLAAGIVAAAIPVLLGGMLVWIAYVNNWNFLNWME